MKSTIRRWVQSSLLALSAVGLTQCVDAVTGSRSDYSTFGLTPVWGSHASKALSVLDEGGFPLDRVRIILIKPVNDTVKDTTVTMHRGDPQVDLPLTVRVVPGVTLQAILQFKSGATILYEGSAVVETIALTRLNPPPVSLPMNYVGPGNNATRVTVTPASGKFSTAANVVFTGTAFDAADVALAGTPLSWSVNDETMGAFTSGGVLAPSGKSGFVTVTATTPTGIAGSATVELVAPSVPTTITLVSGNGQSGTILSTLSPFVVKVTNALGDAVNNVTVTWTRTAGFGTPATGTSTTNASGLASFTYTLGDITGAETVKASVAGVATTADFTVTTTPGGSQVVPIVTGFAYLRVLPSPKEMRVGDTVTFTVDSISASGQATPVTATWASDNPGRGAVDATGRLIVADTGAIVVTATRNALTGHAAVSVLPAPALKAFSFAPKTLTGITNNPLTASFTFRATDAGTGVTSATITLTGPGGVTKTCTFGAPSAGTVRNGVFDCALTFPAGSAAGVWNITGLTLNGSITRTFGESVLALFSSTTLTINP